MAMIQTSKSTLRDYLAVYTMLLFRLIIYVFVAWIVADLAIYNWWLWWSATYGLLMLFESDLAFKALYKVCWKGQSQWTNYIGYVFPFYLLIGFLFLIPALFTILTTPFLGLYIMLSSYILFKYTITHRKGPSV